MKLNQIITVLILGMLSFSCSQSDHFAAQKTQVSDPVIGQVFNETQLCSTPTLVKPEVDFLFLWDNSSSTTFINNETRAALNNIIFSVSEEFDFHMLLAPLIGTGNQNARLVTETPVGLSSSALNMRIDSSQAGSALNFPQASGNFEAGASRAVDLINSNISNGVFRQNAYLVVVVLSNQDDNSWISGNFEQEIHRQNYISQQTSKLRCLRGDANPGISCSGLGNLNSTDMRFMSIVAHSDQCGGSQPQWERSVVYRTISSNLSPSQVDSYDICNQSSFTSTFNQINQSIRDTTVANRYDHWPVATAGSLPIDPNEITVNIINENTNESTSIPRLLEPVANGANGFSFPNVVDTVNTRFFPSAGEAFTGYYIRLYGNARLQYPNCIQVNTVTPKEYFGFIAIPARPAESTIQVIINGQTIPKSTTNGWELITQNGQPLYHPSKNIKIAGPNNFSPGTPGVFKSGYIIKLNGNAIYSNGASTNVNYTPTGN